METPTLRPDTIDQLRFSADAAFAMLAAIQLDVFTPLKDGPMSAEEIAAAIHVGPGRLRLVLYCLVAAGLLTEKDGRFANTPEAAHFLVAGKTSYIGNRYLNLAHRWDGGGFHITRTL